jgi:hypothetical protein
MDDECAFEEIRIGWQLLVLYRQYRLKMHGFKGPTPGVQQ